MLAPKGLKSPWNNSEAMLAAEALNVLMWVLAVTLCGALISRRFLVQQPWLSSSLSKMWKGEFCLNFLFSFVKLQNNSDLEKFRKNLHLGYRSLVFITKADSSEPPRSTCHVVFPTWRSYPHPLPWSASWDQGPVIQSTAGGAGAGAGRAVYMGPLILDNFTDHTYWGKSSLAF